MLSLTAIVVGCGIIHKAPKHTSLTTSPNYDRYVVILSLDGFRSDYQSKANTPTLDKMDA